LRPIKGQRFIKKFNFLLLQSDTRDNISGGEFLHNNREINRRYDENTINVLFFNLLFERDSKDNVDV
jgi:hypothetical protein